MAVMMFNKKMTLVLLIHVRFLTLTQICTIRDRSLFIAMRGRGGCSGGFWPGGSLDFEENKRGDQS